MVLPLKGDKLKKSTTCLSAVLASMERQRSKQMSYKATLYLYARNDVRSLQSLSSMPTTFMGVRGWWSAWGGGSGWGGVSGMVGARGWWSACGGGAGWGGVGWCEWCVRVCVGGGGVGGGAGWGGVSGVVVCAWVVVVVVVTARTL